MSPHSLLLSFGLRLHLHLSSTFPSFLLLHFLLLSACLLDSFRASLRYFSCHSSCHLPMQRTVHALSYLEWAAGLSAAFPSLSVDIKVII